MNLAYNRQDATGQPRTDEAGLRRVLVTGAAGRIGSYFCEHSRERYALRMTDLPDIAEDERKAVERFGEFIPADLTDLEAARPLFGDIDTVVHLAADPSPKATWDKLLPANIVATYNAFAAAKDAGCRRVVYASSIHAVSGYPPDVQVKTTEPVNPGDLYGVTKCFGEALARYMALREGVAAVAIRIGAYQPISKAKTKEALRFLDAFISQRDLTQLIQKSIEAEHVRFAIVHGVSDNRFKCLDISDACELLDYEPMDDVTELQPDLRELDLDSHLSTHAKEKASESGLRKDVKRNKKK